MSTAAPPRPIVDQTMPRATANDHLRDWGASRHEQGATYAVLKLRDGRWARVDSARGGDVRLRVYPRTPTCPCSGG